MRTSVKSVVSVDNRPDALSGPCDRSLTRISTFVTFRATKELFHIARMRQVRRVTWPNFEIADQFASHVPGVWSNRTIVSWFVASRLSLPGDLRVRMSEVTYLSMGDRLGPLNGPCDRDLTRILRLNFFTSRDARNFIASREANCKCASRGLVSRSLLTVYVAGLPVRGRIADSPEGIESQDGPPRLGVFTGLSRSRLAVSSGIHNQLSRFSFRRKNSSNTGVSLISSLIRQTVSCVLSVHRGTSGRASGNSRRWIHQVRSLLTYDIYTTVDARARYENAALLFELCAAADKYVISDKSGVLSETESFSSSSLSSIYLHLVGYVYANVSEMPNKITGIAFLANRYRSKFVETVNGSMTFCVLVCVKKMSKNWNRHKRK